MASSPDSSKLGASLIPKLSRLQPNEISNAMQGSGQLSGILFFVNYEDIVNTTMVEKFRDTIYIMVYITALDKL